MVLKSKTTGSSTNSLRFSEIEDEFGINSGSTINPGKRSLGNYRVSQSFGQMTNLPLDTGIQQNTSNTDKISFSDFYDKQANIIIDCYTSGNLTCNHDAYIDRFAANKYEVVGRFRTVSKNQWDNGKKVIIHVNKTFGSKNATSRNDVALKVGDISDEEPNAWPTTTTLSVNIGTQGLVAGKGGDGGRGGYEGKASLVPGNGQSGSSGMKIHSGMSITGETRIRGGGGGGGGGVGISGIDSSGNVDYYDQGVRAFGGGGGGGNGVPGGVGGAGGVTLGDFDAVPERKDFDYDGQVGTKSDVLSIKTFNPAGNINQLDNTITIGSHSFREGQRVRYSNGGGTSIGGLNSNQIYFVTLNFKDVTNAQNKIGLALNANNQKGGFLVNLSNTFSGSSHSLSLIGRTGGPGARVTTGTDDSGDVEEFANMGRGGNGGDIGQSGTAGSTPSDSFGNFVAEYDFENDPGGGGTSGLQYITY